MKKNLRIVLFLTFLGMLGAIAIIPYQISLVGDVIEESSELPLSVIVMIGTIQTVIFLFIASFIGVRLQERTGLDIPHLKAWVNKTEQPPCSWKWIGIGVLISFLGAILIVLLDLYIFLPRITGVEEQHNETWWHGFLAILYGGFTEEILIRLFVMTLIVWILAKISRKKREYIPSFYYWIGIILASLLFGIGHLPATVGFFGELTTVLVLRALVLNGALGIWFSYLYWKKGLEYAMISHIAADFFLHGIFVNVM